MTESEVGSSDERRSDNVELRTCAYGWPEGCKYHLPEEWVEWCVPCLQRDGKAICTCTCPKPDGDDPCCAFHGRFPPNEGGHACRRDAIVDGVCIDCERPPAGSER